MLAAGGGASSRALCFPPPPGYDFLMQSLSRAYLKGAFEFASALPHGKVSLPQQSIDISIESQVESVDSIAKSDSR